MDMQVANVRLKTGLIIHASLACCLVFLGLIPQYAEIIHRMVAVVEGRVITQSDVAQERKIRAILDEKAIEDDTALIQQLVEQHLIETQIADFPGVEVSDDEIDAELSKKTNADVPRDILREAIRKRIRISKYFELRFRQFIRASDEDVRKYYEQVFVPGARQRGLNPIPSLEQVADAVRTNVIEEQLNHEVNNWLEAIRRKAIAKVNAKRREDARSEYRKSRRGDCGPQPSDRSV